MYCVSNIICFWINTENEKSSLIPTILFFRQFAGTIFFNQFPWIIGPYLQLSFPYFFFFCWSQELHLCHPTKIKNWVYLTNKINKIWGKKIHTLKTPRLRIPLLKFFVLQQLCMIFFLLHLSTCERTSPHSNSKGHIQTHK